MVRIAEEYGLQFEDMLRDAAKATDMLQDFQVELQNYAPVGKMYGEPSPGGADDYRMEDPDYRVEEPEEQKEEPDTWMEEIPDHRLEVIPEEAEEKVEEKEEEKKEEGDEGEPMSEEDWKRLLRRGPPGTSMKELLDLCLLYTSPSPRD